MLNIQQLGIPTLHSKVLSKNVAWQCTRNHSDFILDKLIIGILVELSSIMVTNLDSINKSNIKALCLILLLAWTS